MIHCDYKGCKNVAYVEVGHTKKWCRTHRRANCGAWSYLCNGHWKQQKNKPNILWWGMV